jgi:hypothetical protein
MKISESKRQRQQLSQQQSKSDDKASKLNEKAKNLTTWSQQTNPEQRQNVSNKKKQKAKKN